MNALQSRAQARSLVYLCLTTLLWVAAVPAVAHAQAVGGGGGSFLTGLLNWVSGNVVTTISSLAVIVVGFVMMSMRAHWITIMMVCAGIWVAVNYQTVVSMIQT